MIQSNIKTYLTAFTAFDLDNFFAASPTNAQLYELLNWAARTYSEHTWCNYHDKITFTLTTGTSYYNIRASTVCDRKVLYPRRVTLNTVMLKGVDGAPGLWSLQELESLYPSYQSDSNGTPTKAVWLPGGKLLINVPPNATAAAATNYISGVYIAADLATDGTDANSSPDIPEERHEILAYIAAARAAMPNVSEQEGWQRILSYQTMESKAIAEDARLNKSKILGPSRSRANTSEWLSEYVGL